MTLSDQDRAFEEEVRRFLDEAFDPVLREQTARQAGVFSEPEVSRRWHKALFDKGWITPTWPVEYGGCGWTAMQRHIFDRECARLGTPILPGMGIGLCGPVIMRFGTAEQREFFLPRMRSGEHYWCQGYSEPGAGSDLASLQTQAVLDGDHYVVNGTKIWTTHAHYANWIFMLVRTSNEGRPQAGITFLVSPMDAPGITVRPIVSISGEHEVNQIFFDNVRVPVGNRVGEENAGWAVAKYLLEFERGGGSHGGKLAASVEEIMCAASQECADDEGRLANDPAFRRQMADLAIQSMAIDWTERRLTFHQTASESLGDATASLKKLVGTEAAQLLSEMKLQTTGHYAAADQRASLGAGANEPPVGPEHGVTAMAKYLNGRATTIFGGAKDVQRNILARVILGPRER